MPFPFEEKMKSAQAGDKAAYAEVLTELTGILRGFVMKRLSDHGQAEDVVQEILISIHKARHTYEPSRAFLPWVFAIANFRLVDHLRKVYRHREHEGVSYDDIQEHIADDVTEPHMQSELLNRALATLAPRQRHIIEMMHIEGYTAKEIGNKLGMTPSAVKVAAHRAYKFLREKFRDDDK